MTDLVLLLDVTYMYIIAINNSLFVFFPSFTPLQLTHLSGTLGADSNEEPLEK